MRLADKLQRHGNSDVVAAAREHLAQERPPGDDEGMWGTRSQHFDTLSLSANQATDVCVVGAGLAGLFCSVLLAEGGARVTVVDADPQPLGRGR